ncbi:DNA-protecting protein DprA, partial [Candidatus Bipolaricaulota bacterium]|nr:DNA-protecting protein DprA [Candidatus Bipolaricaulota bacterium]
SRARELGARILTWEEEGYPKALQGIPNPPPVLYVLGELGEKDELAIAIVGTRRCTSYGRVVAERLARELAAVGITVVSGLAPGIDTAAHRGALSTGRTIAVLGTGLGRPYPAGSEPLIRRIAASGAVVSEFPFEQGGTQWTFPRRNRIIAGLALGVVVVEAPARSGALITVERALEQGKEVLAVPGPITSEASAGTNRLIQEGAKLVTCVEDILEEFSMPSLLPPEGKAQGQRDLDPEAKAVYDLVGLEPLGLSELVERTGLPHSRLSQILVELELSGLVREVTGRRYIRAR